MDYTVIKMRKTKSDSSTVAEPEPKKVKVEPKKVKVEPKKVKETKKVTVEKDES